MSDPKPERLYTVMTRSHRPFDDRLLALRSGPPHIRDGFWTADEPDNIAGMSLAQAEAKARSLDFNQPQVRRLEKAARIITAQRDAALAICDDSGPGL